MSIDSDPNGAPARMRKRVLAVLVATVFIATGATFLGAQRYFTALEMQAAQNQMTLYLRSLNETFGQHQHLPFVLARDPRYSDNLRPDALERDINTRLLQLSEQAQLEAIYLMDDTGEVLAASNAGQPNTFLGQNYGFRPYFTEAFAGRRSDYFAIGATSGRPGYFVAEPVTFAAGTQDGVVAIKVDMSELQRSWEGSDETVVAVNPDGIVVLASNPDWLYRPVAALSPAARQTILDSRQFGNQPLTPLNWDQSGDGTMAIDGNTYIMAVGDADWRGWRVHYLRPEARVIRQTLSATALFGSIIALLVGFATFLRSRRIELAYAASERQRAALTRTNEQLEQAQSELASTAKLAALGHLAASVTHELGQPISAFRNHLAAAEIGGEITSPKTASSLNKLVERMEAITTQFRYFARGKPEAKTAVPVSSVLDEVIALFSTDISAHDIALRVHQPAEPVVVWANKILLEQAVTNLIKNAIQAVQDMPNPEVTVRITPRDTTVDITVSDNGPGLGGADLIQLKEPFYSTKPSGVGMGLGLAITTEIIKDHGGALSLADSDSGAEFTVTLPLHATPNASSKVST